MTRIEQFVYTTTEPGVQSGYRVVARSPGIEDQTLSELEPYMLPAGVDPRNFGQSKSMLLVRNGTHVAYSLTRNVGRGHDGRPDAMSTHALVLDVKSFGDLSYDTRNLDALFSGTVPSAPLLPSVTIAAGARSPPNPDIVSAQTPLLTRILYALLRGSRVAVRGACGEQLAQAALGILPPELRLVPFSTCAVDLSIQPAYKFVLLGGSPATNLPKGFTTVDKQSRMLFADAYLGRTVRYLVAMATVGGPHLAALHAEFEKIETLPPRKRLGFLTAVLRMAQSPKPMQSGTDVQVVAEHLARLSSTARDRILSGLGSNLNLRDRSDLLGVIAARYAQHNISDYEATRSSIEQLLGQANTDLRQELLRDLYESKKLEMRESIDHLFTDFCYSYFGKDFFKFVASTPDLACRVKKFVGMSGKNPFRLQAVVRLFVLASLESGLTFSIEPSIFKPYDLSNIYDLDSFESLLSEVFSSDLVTPDSDFCVAVATAGLFYMAGFDQRHIPSGAWSLDRHAKRFSTLADRLTKVVSAKDGTLHGDNGNAKANEHTSQLLSKCGVAVSGAGG